MMAALCTELLKPTDFYCILLSQMQWTCWLKDNELCKIYVCCGSVISNHDLPKFILWLTEDPLHYHQWTNSDSTDYVFMLFWKYFDSKVESKGGTPTEQKFFSISVWPYIPPIFCCCGHSELTLKVSLLICWCSLQKCI